MLMQFEVGNYKSIKSLTLDFRPFMVLVGPNGAGKTNIVSALKLFGDLLSRGTTAPARENGWSQIVHREKKPARGGLKLAATFDIPRRLLRPIGERIKPGDRSESIEARVSFVLRGSTGGHDIAVASEEFRLGPEDGGMLITREDNEIVVDSGKDPTVWSAFRAQSFGAPHSRKERGKFAVDVEPQAFMILSRAYLGRLYRELAWQSSTTRLRLDTSALRSDARFDRAAGAAIGPSGEGLPVAVDELRGRGARPGENFKPILAALREVYPRIEDVHPEPFAQGRVSLLFQERGISDPIPLDSVSDGVLHALALLIALRNHERGVLAIEEPENALHPWSVRKILERAQSGSVQRIIMTTHSETVVNSVTDPDSLFIVEGDEVTGTAMTPATSKEHALKAILAESGQQLGDLWVDGTLGGVPT